jgi:hypothetical protein
MSISIGQYKKKKHTIYARPELVIDRSDTIEYGKRKMYMEQARLSFANRQASDMVCFD